MNTIKDMAEFLKFHMDNAGSATIAGRNSDMMLLTLLSVVTAKVGSAAA